MAAASCSLMSSASITELDFSFSSSAFCIASISLKSGSFFCDLRLFSMVSCCSSFFSSVSTLIVSLREIFSFLLISLNSSTWACKYWKSGVFAAAPLIAKSLSILSSRPGSPPRPAFFCPATCRAQ